MRFKRVLAAAGVLMLGAVAAGCGEDDSTSLPEASDASSVPSVAEQEKAVANVVERYLKLNDEIGKTGDGSALEPVATQSWINRLEKNFEKSLGSKGLIIIGSERLVDSEVALDGQDAVANACVDDTNTFVVPKGTTKVEAGTDVQGGARAESIFHLAYDAGDWKVDRVDSHGDPCDD